MPRVLIALTVLVSLVALRGGGPDLEAPRALAAGDCTASASLDVEERQFLVLLNNHRAANGRAPLRESHGLSKAAQWKSQDLGENAYFAHDDLARTWVDRIRDCGYGYNVWLGENIAAGMSGAQAAFNAWKNSPGHNENMLSPNYTAVGIGRANVPGSPYGWYWTTDFGGYADGLADVGGGPDAPEILPEEPAAEEPNVQVRASWRRDGSLRVSVAVRGGRVTEVALFASGEKLATDRKPPYRFDVPAARATDGADLRIVATDAAGTATQTTVPLPLRRN